MSAIYSELRDKVLKTRRPAASFCSKVPHKTLWLEIAYPIGEKPTGLLKALQEVGWANDPRFHAPIAPVDDIQVISLQCRGSGMFGNWTPAERRQFMHNAQRILVEFGLGTEFDWYKLRLEDLL